MKNNYNQMSLEELLQLAETQAFHCHDGHLTIMKFTTNWKAFFGTPDLRGGDSYDSIWRMKGHKTMRDALVDLLENNVIVRYQFECSLQES